MSLADFSQDAQDHAHLFVYVTALGETSGALYGAVMETLRDFPPIHPRGSKDSLIFIRFLNHLPRWAKEGQPWLEFQAYKQVLGVLAITQCHDLDDLKAVAGYFQGVCDHFKESLCDSRCVVYGPKATLGKAVHSSKGFTLVNFDNQRSFSKADVNVSGLEGVITDFADSIFITLQSKIANLKKGLEGGRLEVSLRSPLETETEEETRLPRNQMIGRLHKHIADLYLLCGQLQQASTHFTQAMPSLTKDFLWAGSANEGLGATFIIKSKCDELLGQRTAPLSVQSNVLGGFLKVPGMISGPRLTLKPNLDLTRKRNSTASEGGGGEERVMLTNGRSSVYRRPKSPSPDHLLDMSEDATDNVDLNSTSDSGSGIMFVDEREGGEGEGGEGEMGEGEVGEEEESDLGSRKLLQKDLVVDRFARAELYYKKAGAIGGVPRIELLFKFAKYLVSQERHKEACNVLQKVFWIECYIDDKDKTTLYESIAEVFTSMGFHRKAAMFTHWAALHAESLAVTQQEFYQSIEKFCKAHKLLLKCLPGYKLSPDVTKVTTPVPSGWPLLQARVLKDLVFLAQRTEQNATALQHSCILLQTLHSSLDHEDITSIIDCLEEITQFHSLRDQDSKQRRRSLGLSEEDLKSPLPLTEFPQVCLFRPKELPPHLKPHRTEGHRSLAAENSQGPFIYSALSGRGKKHQKPEVVWVIKDPAEVALELSNLLNFELRVERMKVLWDGVALDAFPSSLTLPPSEQHTFALLAVPQEVGKVDIVGYEHTVFGVHSKRELKSPNTPTIKVIPSLPQLRIRILPVIHAHSTSQAGESPHDEHSPLRRGDSNRCSVGPKIGVDMIDGESCKLEFKLECLKGVEISMLSVSVTSTSEQKPEDYCSFSCPGDDLSDLLPLAKREQRSFIVTISAKFPPYFRIKNDLMADLTRHPSSTEPPPSPGGSIVKQLSFRNRSRSPHAAVAKRQSHDGFSPPSVSPVSKRPPGRVEIQPRRKGGFFAVRHGQSIAPSEPTPPSAVPGFDSSNLMSSLNLEYPSASVLSTSSPSSFPNMSPHNFQHGMSPKFNVKGFSLTRSPKFGHRTVEQDWDFEQYDKRASIRSDPGDRKRDGLSSALSHSPKHITSPVQKSPSAATGLYRVGRQHDSLPRTGGESFFYDQEGSPRLPWGHFKTPSRSPMRKGGAGITKKNISGPTGPLTKKRNTLLEKGVTVKGNFTFKYSGGEGEEAGYHRQMVATVEVRVHKSLSFDEFQVSLVDGKPDYFSLSFQLQNESNYSVHVTCSSKQGEDDIPHLHVQKEPFKINEKRRVEMLLRRFTLPGTHMLELQNSSNTTKLYSDHLAKMVTVQWQIKEKRKSGAGNLEGLRLPSSVLPILQPVPLVIALRVNNRDLPLHSTSSEGCPVGCPFNILITVRNNTGATVPPSWLLIDLCKFDKQISRRLAGKFMHSGNMQEKIPQLEKGETYEHSVSLMFFYKGVYEMEVKVSITPSETEGKMSPEDSLSVTSATKGVGGGVGGGESVWDTTMSTRTREEAGPVSPILMSSVRPLLAESTSDISSHGGSLSPKPSPFKIRAIPVKAPHMQQSRLDGIVEEENIVSRLSPPQKVKVDKPVQRTGSTLARSSLQTITGPSLSINVDDDCSV